MRSVLAVLALAAGVAHAACPNACSGHGTCESNYDACTCYSGWGAADCSERLCPFASAWVDLPQGDLDYDNSLDSGGQSTDYDADGVGNDKNINPSWRPTGWYERHPAQLYGSAASDDSDAELPFYVRQDEGHFYAECAGAGLCDRSTGICDCFPPFGGSACNRTVCPSDCSGHGTCRSTQELLPTNIEYYNLWDATKIFRCDCDGGWGGLDCGQRQCPRGDDPLTTVAGRPDYNRGLTESAEIQYIDIRCPYNGKIVNPYVSLRFTDPEDLDVYETSFFDITETDASADSNVLDLLKALPNGVLADYVVDGVTVSAKIDSVNVQELETDTYYRVAVTFKASYGNVPNMGARVRSDFLCTNGVKVNTAAGTSPVYENVATTIIGDGPRRSLRFVLEVEDVAAGTADTFDYYVQDYNTLTIAALNDELAETYKVTAVDFSATETALQDATDFHADAAKVKFLFELGDDATRHDDAIYIIDYIVEPVITVRPVTYTFGAAATTAVNGGSDLDSYAVADDTASGTVKLTFTTASVAPYDYKIKIVSLTSTVNAVYVNDEFIAYGSADFQSAVNPLDVSDNIPTGYGGRVPTNLGAAIGTAVADGALDTGVYYRGWPGKVARLVHTIDEDDDDIDVTFNEHRAPEHSITLVLKYSDISTSTDQYVWKLAGDTEFSAAGNVPAAATATALTDADDYVDAYPDDEVRAGVAYVLLAWDEGADNDNRICTTDSRIYIHIGSDGINDRPECSNRGICDYSSGLCNCFAGYTGPDCASQSVLAGAR